MDEKERRKAAHGTVLRQVVYGEIGPELIRAALERLHGFEEHHLDETEHDIRKALADCSAGAFFMPAPFVHVRLGCSPTPHGAQLAGRTEGR